MKDPQLYYHDYTVIFAKKNNSFDYYPTCYTGFKVLLNDDKSDFSDNWISEFVSLCDQCKDKTCNTKCKIEKYNLFFSAEKVKVAKKEYFKIFPINELLDIK